MRLAVLQPAASGVARTHYQDTVASPVPLVQHEQVLGADFGPLMRAHPDGHACLWGATPGRNDVNVRPYTRMAPGDYVFFSGGGRLFAGATVTHSFRNAGLAEDLWGRDNKDQTWDLMFALDELRALDIPYTEMNSVVGYQANNVVQGFTVLDEDRSAALFDFFALDSDLHPAAPTRDELERRLADLPTDTDAIVDAVRRLEQGLLRRTLLPGTVGECALCGDELPVQFLVAAHIKKRSSCTPAERLDIRAIAMPACKFGCDALYETGFIGVDTSGAIAVSNLAPVSGAAGEQLRRYVGRRVAQSLWAASNSYFNWHWQNIYKQAP